MNEQNQQPSNYVSGNKFFILHDFNKDLRDGIIIPFTNKIEELSIQKEPGCIDIYINSHGGNGETCMHIVALIELAKAKGITVRTIVTQTAFSAGSIVACAGTKGERYIAENAEHCLHYGTHYGFAETTPLQIDRNSDHKRRWFGMILKHYQKYANVPKLEEHLKDDSFFVHSKDAIKWGLADKMIEELA